MSEAPDALMDVRSPRCVVKANGKAVAGWTSVEIDQNVFYDPDTFRVELAMDSLPDDHDAAWFAAQSDIEIEILVGFPADPNNYTAGDLTSLFVGDVDEPEFKWDERVLSLSGRDKTHLLVDHKTSEKYVNLTASQVATKLASKYGLTPVVIATKTRVGRFYQIDHVNLQDDRTEWDLLTWLAREEGYNVFVKGRELHFEPPKTGGTPYAVRYTPSKDGGPPTSNTTSLVTHRTLTVAKDITVTVRTWNSKKKRAIIRQASSRTHNSKATVQKYTYTFPGLDPDQAQKRADKIRDELSKHEMNLEFEGPADLTLAVDQTISLQGTGTVFDQTYYPESIERRLTNEGGFRWTVKAKNHNPESTPSP